MKNTIKLIQEATGKESNVFGELRSLLASPSPQNYLRLAPIITEQHKSNPNQFQSDIEPYLQAQIKRWPDNAKAVPLDILIALVNATPSLASSPDDLMRGKDRVYTSDKSIPFGVVWIAKNAIKLDGDNLVLEGNNGKAKIEVNKTAFGSSNPINFKMSYNYLNNLFELEAINKSRLKSIVISGADNDFPDGESLYAIKQQSKSLSKLVWLGVPSSSRNNYGALRFFAHPYSGEEKIANIRELKFAVKYTKPDDFEDFLYKIYENNYGFEVLELQIIETRQLSLMDAREIIARVNADVRRGNQRIIAVDE